MKAPQFSRRTALILAGGIVATEALAIEPRWLEVVLYDVPVPGLPTVLDGYQIAHVTDAHLKELGVVEQSIIAEVRRRNVQLVALTGDMIDAAENLPILQELSRELRVTGAAVVATLGNWEHWRRIPLDLLASSYSDVGARLMVNQGARIQGVRVWATDDDTAGRVDRGGALRPPDTKEASVLLTHSPAVLDQLVPQASAHDLALAGHTHGGQLRLSARLVPFVPPGSGRFVAGWYPTAAGPAYVSRGTGTSIVPARLACRPEMPIFRLRRA